MYLKTFSAEYVGGASRGSGRASGGSGLAPEARDHVFHAGAARALDEHDVPAGERSRARAGRGDRRVGATDDARGVEAGGARARRRSPAPSTPTATRRSTALRGRAAPTSRCQRPTRRPSSRISPSTAIRRVAGSPASVRARPPSRPGSRCRRRSRRSRRSRASGAPCAWAAARSARGRTRSSRHRGRARADRGGERRVRDVVLAREREPRRSPHARRSSSARRCAEAAVRLACRGATPVRRARRGASAPGTRPRRARAADRAVHDERRVRGRSRARARPSRPRRSRSSRAPRDAPDRRS